MADRQSDKKYRQSHTDFSPKESLFEEPLFEEDAWEDLELEDLETGEERGSRDSEEAGKQPAEKPGSARSTGKRKRRRKNARENYIHFVLIGIIALIAIVAAVRLIVWNIGRDSGYDPTEDTSEFDTEALDYVQPLDPDLLQGREDDGVNTIVCLGNAPFADERGQKGLAQILADRCDASVYNCAFPDSYISMKNPEYSDSFPQDGLSLYLVTASLCGGDYSLMEHAAGLLDESVREGAVQALDTLKSVDFSAVDMIVIMYDLSDYKDKRPVMDENNDINLLTWNGALNASIQLIQQTYPHIRLVVLSPGYGEFEDDNGAVINPEQTDYGNGVLSDYVLHEIDVAMFNGVSILDNFYGTIIEGRSEDLLTDGYHLTEKGRQQVAARFAKEIFGLE